MQEGGGVVGGHRDDPESPALRGRIKGVPETRVTLSETNITLPNHGYFPTHSRPLWSFVTGQAHVFGEHLGADPSYQDPVAFAWQHWLF